MVERAETEVTWWQIEALRTELKPQTKTDKVQTNIPDFDTQKIFSIQNKGKIQIQIKVNYDFQYL